MLINPKPKSDWRKGDKSVFDKRKGSTSVSERKGEYKKNISQKKNLANYNSNKNICYTENNSSGNNHNNISYVDNNKVNHSDMNVNVHYRNTMPNRSNSNFDNNYIDSCQNSRHRRKNSSVSGSQNFESICL